MLAGIANDWQENDANEMFALTIVTNQVAGLTGSLGAQMPEGRGMDTVSCYALTKIEFFWSLDRIMKSEARKEKKEKYGKMI